MALPPTHEKSDVGLIDCVLVWDKELDLVLVMAVAVVGGGVNGYGCRRRWAAIRPAMLYGSECWPITKALAFRVKVAELRMLRWTCGKTMVDMISNEVFREALDVDSIIDKMREGRLRWFGHVKRRPQSAPVRRVEAMVVEGSRRRGRPKHRWEDRLKMDMKELRLSKDMTSDRNAWRDKIRISR
nr:polyprotein, putative [Tanacetum cinerariifolium]